MTVREPTDVDFKVAAQQLINAGFTGWQVVTFGAIGYAESLLIDWQTHLNTKDPADVAYLSTDWGKWGINDYWNERMVRAKLSLILPNKTFGQYMLDPDINARAARVIFLAAGGAKNAVTGYLHWNAYDGDLYHKGLTRARAAAKACGVTV